MKRIALATALFMAAGSFSAFAVTTSEMAPAQAKEITKAAVKKAKEEMMGHKKIGTISGSASTSDDLDAKFTRAATEMGAKYFVITSLNTHSEAYGTADLYN